MLFTSKLMATLSTTSPKGFPSGPLAPTSAQATLRNWSFVSKRMGISPCFTKESRLGVRRRRIRGRNWLFRALDRIWRFWTRKGTSLGIRNRQNEGGEYCDERVRWRKEEGYSGKMGARSREGDQREFGWMGARTNQLYTFPWSIEFFSSLQQEHGETRIHDHYILTRNRVGWYNLRIKTSTLTFRFFISTFTLAYRW